MRYSEHRKAWTDLLHKPVYSVWRHVFIVPAMVAITLSQSFFVFGGSAAVPTSTIYFFGTGLAVCTLGIIYCNVYYLAPHFLSKRAYASYMLVLLCVVSVLIFVKQAVEYSVFANVGISREWNGVTILDGISNMVLYTICVASTSITILFRQLIADNAEIENLESKRLKNSIDEFKNRIQPRFLFAILDFASQKVKSEPRQASETLFKLSELLRYQLYDSAREKVLLASEIVFIRNYLQLQQQNSKNGFLFEFSVSGNSNKFVAPAAFIPCIEEIFNYHPEKLVLKMNIEESGTRLECIASGIDFGKRDFSKTEQNLRWMYGSGTRIKRKESTLETYLKIC